jgi:hypothetical protein
LYLNIGVVILTLTAVHLHRLFKKKKGKKKNDMFAYARQVVNSQIAFGLLMTGTTASHTFP